MSDAMLSVEVIANLEKFAAGLKKGTGYMSEFASESDTLIKGVENRLKNLGAGSMKGLSRALAAQSLENQRLVNSILQLQSTQQAANTAAQQNVAALIQQRIATKQNRTATTAATATTNQQRTATEAQRTANQQTTASLIQQRIATEAMRTAAAGTRAQTAALSLTNAQNRASTVALSGSYREAQQRLTALGQQIRSVSGGFSSQSPLMQARIREYNQLNERLKAFDASLGNHQRKVGDYGGALKNAGSGLLSMASGYLSVGSALNFVFDQTLKFDRIKTPLGFILGSEGDANMKLRDLKTLANELGLEYFTLAASYKQFTAAAIASNFPLKDSEKIFLSVSKAAAVLKLSDEQLSGSLLALQQMISKGNVQAEELRGQLAERLPGAFALAAKAMGVTEVELNRLLKSGEVLASELLPKLANELDKKYGDKAAEGISGLSAEVGRLQSSLQSLAGEGSALSNNIFEPMIRGIRLVADELHKTFRGTAWENLQRFMTFSKSGRESIDRAYNIKTQFKDSKSALAGLRDQEYVGMPLGELRNYYAQIQKNVLAANRNYEQFATGIKAVNLKEEFEGQLNAYKQLTLSFIEGRKFVGREIDRQKELNKLKKGEILELKSIKEIRAEITRLSALPGSATKGSDVANKIASLKAQLRPAKIVDPKSIARPFESVEKQLQAFQSRANIITKEGLSKDLQEWEDKYTKIKAVIDKLPNGARKSETTATLETNYKEGKTNILEANSREIMAVIKKRNDDIALLEMNGSAREIEQVKIGYAEQIRLAEGNAAGIALIKKQQTAEISRIHEDQAVKDRTVIAAQIADIAKEYREHQAEMFMLAKKDGYLAVEVAENEKAKNELKQSYADRLIDFSAYQAQMGILIEQGNALEIKPPVFDIEHFKNVALEAKKSIYETLENFIDSGLASAIADSFTGIGTAIAEGGDVFGAAAKGMQASFAELLGALGQQFITMGVAKMAAGALMSPFGWKEIGQGAALVALGSGLSIGGGYVGSMNKGSGGSKPGSTSPEYGVPHFATGVKNFKGGIALVGEKGPELVNLPTGSDVIPNHIAFPPITMPSMQDYTNQMIERAPSVRPHSRENEAPTFVISNKIHMGELVTAIERQKRTNSRL